MSKSYRGRLAADHRSTVSKGGLLIAAAAVAGTGLLAGCNGASATAAGSPTAAGSGTAAASAAAASAGASGGASTGASTTAAPAASSRVAFVPVTEPFDPGHPARAVSSPANCGAQATTLAMEQCFENKTETADAAIDTLQRASFASAPAAQQSAINAEDSGWLSARKTVCDKAYQTGGTIDGINISGCLLDESTARMDALKGITPPEAMLRSTDSTSLSDLSWYTTPEGSRIAMIDTQGDSSGGAVIAWVIIAGADGFTVNPAQFFYQDGAFTDPGTIPGTNSSGHRVAPLTEYQFSIDYSHLRADPNASKGSGGWVYAPGTPVAAWR